jgi:hypothetical protein
MLVVSHHLRRGMATRAADFHTNDTIAGGGAAMRKSTGNLFDGRVLNPSGMEIRIPYWAYRRLKKLHLLERDLDSGRRRISPDVYGLMEIWEAPEFNPDRGVSALALNSSAIRPRGEGRANSFLQALGRDCSGLA